MKLEVIHEPEKQAPALRVKVVLSLLYDMSAWHIRYALSGALPGLGGRYCKLKRQDLVIFVARVA